MANLSIKVETFLTDLRERAKTYVKYMVTYVTVLVFLFLPLLPFPSIFLPPFLEQLHIEKRSSKQRNYNLKLQKS